MKEYIEFILNSRSLIPNETEDYSADDFDNTATEEKFKKVDILLDSNKEKILSTMESTSKLRDYMENFIETNGKTKQAQ